MSDDKLLEKRNRAQQAKDLLENPVLIEGFDKLRDEYIRMWALTQPNQDREREILWLAYNAIGKVRDHLSHVIADGKMADSKLKELIQTQERKKLFGIV